MTPEEETQSVLDALTAFYKQYIVTTADQSFQVFQSFTYGEMTISALLLTGVFLYVARWIWDVLR